MFGSGTGSVIIMVEWSENASLVTCAGFDV